VLDFGAACDGTTDDTAAVNAAIAAVVSAGGGILTYNGTPLIKSTITISSTITIQAPRTAHFVKHASVSGNAFLLSGNGIVFNGGGVTGQTGNTGDGIQITGNGVVLRDSVIKSMGGNGIRIGSDTTGANANLFLLDNCTSTNNGGDGIYIHDNPSGAPNANAGSIVNPYVGSNTGNGLRFGNAIYNTVIGGSYEANTQYGLYFDAQAQYNFRYGGDSEMNTVGDVYISATAYFNRVLGRYYEAVTDLTNANTFNKRHEYRTQNYTTHIFQDNQRNWPFVLSTTGVASKTVSAITVSGTTATATITSHGYNANDTFFLYPNISNQNPADTPFGGGWSVATVVDANTITFTLPNTGYPATASETYASHVGYPLGSNAFGEWRIEDGWVTFESWLQLNSGTLNSALTGNLVLWGIPLLNTKSPVRINVDLLYCANLLNYLPIGFIQNNSLQITLDKTPLATAAGAIASIPVADFVINGNTYIFVSGRYRAL
jgi:hypothetical protein